jgi:hypothetical protein
MRRSRPNRFRRIAWGVVGACISIPALATEETDPPATLTAPPARGDTPADVPGAEPPPDETDQILETTRRSVRSTTEWLARGVDSWFGDRPFVQSGGKVLDGRLSLGMSKRQGETKDTSVIFNARFRLPNVEHQSAYLFLGRDDQREVVTDKPGTFSSQRRPLTTNTTDPSFFAGLGLPLLDSVDFRLGFRGGLKLYAQARYRQSWQLDVDDLVEFRETVFWTREDQIGSTTALSYEHAFSSSLAGRWLAATTITQRNSKFEWSSSLGAYKSPGDQRLFSLEALVGGVQGSEVAVADYGVQAKWEQPIHKDWLLGEIAVGHFWPRKDPALPRGQAWAVGYIVKMKF